MGSRTWIKVYCDKWLNGSLREEQPDVRGVWIDLLTLAGSGQYGDTGEVKLTNGIGFTDGQICEILHINIGLWHRAKARFLEGERISISLQGAISITSWNKYQSEYTRQRPYRQQKTVTSTPEPKFPLRIPLEKEIEIESEKLQQEVTTNSYTKSWNEIQRKREQARTQQTPLNVITKAPLKTTASLKENYVFPNTPSLETGKKDPSPPNIYNGKVVEMITTYLKNHPNGDLQDIVEGINQQHGIKLQQGQIYGILAREENKLFLSNGTTWRVKENEDNYYKPLN